MSTYRGKVTEVTTKRTTAQIVDAVAEAGYDLFVERSPSAVSLREIAAAANVNLGLIHRYVGSKDDLDGTSLKDDFPLLEQLAKNSDATSTAMTYALGWEVFGPSLIAALNTRSACRRVGRHTTNLAFSGDELLSGRPLGSNRGGSRPGGR